MASEDFSPLAIQNQLPERLLAALERRYYEIIDVNLPGSILSHYHGSDISAGTRVFEIQEVKYGENRQQSLHLSNMQNVITSLRDGTHSLVYIVNSDGNNVKLQMGVRHFRDLERDDFIPTENYASVLTRALQSNYPGIQLGEILIHDEFEREILNTLEYDNLACLTGIPSLKGSKDDEFFAQSVDRLVDALRGEVFTLLVIAEPVKGEQINEIIFRARRLSEEIHLVVRNSISESKGETDSYGMSEGSSTSVTIGFGSLASLLFGPSISQTITKSKSSQHSISENRSVTQETLNKTAEFCENVLEHYLDRLQRAKSQGFWNVGVYFSTESKNTYMRMHGIARSLYAGQTTHYEPLRVIDLSDADEAREIIQHLRNPYLNVSGHEFHPFGGEYHSLGTPLITEELSTLVSLPSREVPGLRLLPVADFNPNPPLEGNLEIGNIIYRGENIRNFPVKIDTDSLAKHTFISGITGGGKTNTCLVLLKAAWEIETPFLVIEPAKTEYRRLLGDEKLQSDLQIFSLGTQSSPFKINPFEFEEGYNLLAHIDLLKAVFNAAFPMYASMPYILEDAIHKIYRDRGWDIVSSENIYLKLDEEPDRRNYFPTLSDLYNVIDLVVRSKGYDVRLTHDLTAALKARIQSLLLGSKGMMLNVQRSISFKTLLSNPTVLELQEIGDDDEKAFLMALLLIRLYEYCRVNRRFIQDKLQHLTLIEEAHRLLRNIPVSVSSETGNVRGKAVEMFTDMLAEIREYGEGFVIVDQIPSKLIPDVVKNTNLKIIHRLVAQDDRDFVGNAVGLSYEQKEHLVRMQPGEAVVHNEYTYTPLLVGIHLAKKGEYEEIYASKEDEIICKKLDAYRKHSADTLRRWPGCKLCETPCIHFSIKTAPDNQGKQQFQRWFDALLYATNEEIQKRWDNLFSYTAQLLETRYDSKEWNEHKTDILFCHFAQLARQAIAIYYSYYRFHSRGKHRDLVTLERRTMALIHTLLAKGYDKVPNTAFQEVKNVFNEDMARGPVSYRPGCNLCQRKCKYGILVQRHPRMHPKAKPHLAHLLASEFKRLEERRETRGSIGRVRQIANLLTRFATNHTKPVVTVGEDDLPHLAYCYLVNLPNTPKVLRAYQKAIEKNFV